MKNRLAEVLEMEVEVDRGIEGKEGVEGLNGHWKPLSSSLRKHRQDAQLVEDIAGINKRSSARL